MNNQWMSVKEITKLPNMPSTGPGVHKKARREGWKQRKQEGVKGPGVEYLIEADPLESGITQEPNTSYENNSTAHLPPIDKELLETSIEAIELLCHKKNIRMSASKKAKIITLVYMISLEDKTIDESVCYELLELAS